MCFWEGPPWGTGSLLPTPARGRCSQQEFPNSRLWPSFSPCRWHRDQGVHPVPSPGARGPWGHPGGCSRHSRRRSPGAGGAAPTPAPTAGRTRTGPGHGRCSRPVPPHPKPSGGAAAAVPGSRGRDVCGAARSRVAVTGERQLPRGRRGAEPSPAAIFSSSRSAFSLTVSPLRSSVGPSSGDVYPAWQPVGCDTAVAGGGDGWERGTGCGGDGKGQEGSPEHLGEFSLSPAPGGCSALGRLKGSHAASPSPPRLNSSQRDPSGMAGLGELGKLRHSRGV